MSITELTGASADELSFRDLFRYDLDAGRHLDLRRGAA